MLSSTTAKSVAARLGERDPRGPGLAAAVLKDGRLLEHCCWGYAVPGGEQPITPTTIFHLASEGKQFTGLAVAMMLEARAFGLADPLGSILKDIPDYIAGIPIRHLVHHTSGIPDYYDSLEKSGLFAAGCTGEDVMRFLALQGGLTFPCGTKFEYSNSNYFLLARIVEEVSGQPYGQFLNERLFQPLGMCDTSLYPPTDGRSERLAIGQAGNRADGYRPWDYPNAHIPGPGHVYSTLEDLVRFELDIDTTGGRLASLYRSLFQAGQLLDGSAVCYAFGLDWGVYTPQEHGYAVAHGGACAGQCGIIGRMPDDHISVIVLCNCRDIPHIAISWDLIEMARAGSSRGRCL